MSSKVLLVRADASAEIGIGHVMRCLALAQAWQDAGGRVVFAFASGIAEVGKRLHSERMEVVDIHAKPGSDEDQAQTAELCRRLRTNWLVLDGFHFSQRYRETVSRGPDHLLVFDDHGEFASYRCDIVLNTNPYATEEMYPQRDEGVRFLLGPKYGLLRREFLGKRRECLNVPDVARRVLVTFGGSDPDNVTLRVVDALRELPDLSLEVTVVAGAGNPHHLELQKALADLPKSRILLNADNMPELMRSADLAISAGGGTCYELAFLGLPMCLITIAENHARTVNGWCELRAAVTAGWFHQVGRQELAGLLRKVISDKLLRTELGRNAAGIVDGLGATRVVAAMSGRQS